MIQFFKSLFGIKQVDFDSLVKSGAQIIDVRSPQEYKSGHIKNSKNIPLPGLSAHLNSIPKNKAIITVCASGIRSANAKRILSSNGYTVYNGGGWQQLQNKLA